MDMSVCAKRRKLGMHVMRHARVRREALIAGWDGLQNARDRYRTMTAECGMHRVRTLSVCGCCVLAAYLCDVRGSTRARHVDQLKTSIQVRVMCACAYTSSIHISTHARVSATHTDFMCT
jgi:hypothetical protein